jgi:uncharacterized protein YwgA
MNEHQTLQRQTLIYCLVEALRSKGNWCGETHIQKTMFFLDELSNHAVGYEFILYKHGPFSFELSEDLSVMDARGFVKDEIANINYGPRLNINPTVRNMLTEKFGQLTVQVQDAMTFVVNKLADCGVATLERLGTALYFTRKECVDGSEARASRIHEVKPHVTEAQALESVKTVNAILDEWASLQTPNNTIPA